MTKSQLVSFSCMSERQKKSVKVAKITTKSMHFAVLSFFLWEDLERGLNYETLDQ